MHSLYIPLPVPRVLQFYGPINHWLFLEICTQGHLEVGDELGMEAHPLNPGIWNVVEEGASSVLLQENLS